MSDRFQALLIGIFFLTTCTNALPIALGQEPDGKPDRVWLQPSKPKAISGNWYPGAVVVLSGKVLDLDAKQLRFDHQNGKDEAIIAASRVIWIELGDVPAKEKELTDAFASGDFTQSLLALPDALKARPPVWRQQWLTMLAAGAAEKSGRPDIALELVAQLDRRPLPPIVTAWLPIGWSGGRVSKSSIDAAKSRISDDSLMVRLVAASWILGTDERATAIASLQSLSRQRDRLTAAKLAKCLLWTTVTPPMVIESERKWMAQLESLPMALQVGPSVALEKKLRSAGQTESADYLRASIDLTPIHPHPSHNR